MTTITIESAPDETVQDLQAPTRHSFGATAGGVAMYCTLQS